MVVRPVSVRYKEIHRSPQFCTVENGELVCTSGETELLSCSLACANKVTYFITDFVHYNVAVMALLG